MICPLGPELRWKEFNWANFAPKKVQIFFWILRAGNTRTRAFLFDHNIVSTSDCPFCLNTVEDADHLFVQCPSVHLLWQAIPTVWPFHTVDELCTASASMFPTWHPKLKNTLILALLWVVWKHMNKEIFDDVAQSLPTTASVLQEHLRLGLQGSPVGLHTTTRGLVYHSG